MQDRESAAGRELALPHQRRNRGARRLAHAVLQVDVTDSGPQQARPVDRVLAVLEGVGRIPQDAHAVGGHVVEESQGIACGREVAVALEPDLDTQRSSMLPKRPDALGDPSPGGFDVGSGLYAVAEDPDSRAPEACGEIHHPPRVLGRGAAGHRVGVVEKCARVDAGDREVRVA